MLYQRGLKSLSSFCMHLQCEIIIILMLNVLFSGLLVSYHQSIQQALLPQLTSARLAVRKRTIIALGMDMIHVQ